MISLRTKQFLLGLSLFSAGIALGIFATWLPMRTAAPQKEPAPLVVMVHGEELVAISSTNNYPPPEELLLEQIKDFQRKAPPHRLPLDTPVPTIVTQALGLDHLLPATPAVTSTPLPLLPEWPYRQDEVETTLLSVRFTSPAVSPDALYFRHKPDQPRRECVVVIHGHMSSPHKVMGLDLKDYMNEIGLRFFNDGYDVVAPGCSALMVESMELNHRLMLDGVHLYGLWLASVRSICQHLRGKYGYSQIHLYGFSNGGLVAQFVSVLDNDFDKIIVADILTDWLSLAGNDYQGFVQQRYSFRFLRDLWTCLGPDDFLINAKTKVYYTRHPDSLPKSIDPMLYQDTKAKIVLRDFKAHVPDYELTLRLLRTK